MTYLYIKFQFIKCIEYYFIIQLSNYFKKNNIPGVINPIPLVEFIKVINKGQAIYDQELIEKNGKIVGVIVRNKLQIITTDINLIKNALIKDFNSFVNRNNVNNTYFDNK